MNRFEYKVNGETFFSETQIADVAVILQAAYKGKAIGKNPDEHGFRLNVANSSQSFVAVAERYCRIDSIGDTFLQC